MGIPWASAPQEAVLIPEIPNFLTAQRAHTTDRYFQRFFAVWFSIFPIPEDTANRGEEIRAMKEVRLMCQCLRVPVSLTISIVAENPALVSMA
jgi:hypothetical protein